MSTTLRHRNLGASLPETLPLKKTEADKPSFSSTYRRPSHQSWEKQQSAFSYRTLAIVILVALAPWAYQIKLYAKVTQTRQKVASLHREQQSLARELEDAKATLKIITADTEKIEATKKEILADLRRQGDNLDFASQAYAEAEEMENKYLTRVKELEEAIQTASYRHLQLYHPKITVKVKVTLTSGNYFVIQLAPVEVAPHAASHFVRIAEAKLYDGLSLVHGNSGSGDIYATMIGTTDNDKFKKANLTKVAFVERPEHYKNEKYSVAFSSRGPMFYINMGGEEREVVEGDICFGKVVEGRDVLDAIVRNKGLFSMVGIQSVEAINESV
ncbi:hypothetical protein FisN_3Hh073 [Fistulifera solaris]|uniref:PPIase cyclophilin-type domain-containing protein n=1 Tax=Fistulifera solaris TaxID=1519565 RepID=A0A1Z5JNJ5_FISSO|nr:hypothetical protein FisN_3Hh073 [Fistulifera solaris]|eukprot:GAX15603.1 hypothetical protein FisN_3Hh073 [Fistulifera solaris]